MGEEKPIWEGRMRKLEPLALVYELPAMLCALILGGLLAVLYTYVITHFLLFMVPHLPLAILLGLAAIGLGSVFGAANLFPRGIKVYPDRLHFDMLLGKRDVPVKNISACAAMNFEQTRRTFFSPRFANLSPAVRGAVLLTRTKGRAWVFSPEKTDEFLSAAAGIMAPQK